MTVFIPTLRSAFNDGALILWRALQGAGHAIAGLVELPEAATIDAVSVLVNSIVGTPPDYEVAIQGRDSSGEPDGTDLATGTITSSGLSAGTRETVSLASSVALLAGRYWVVVRDGATAPDGSNYVRFAYYTQVLRDGYTLYTTGGAWTITEGASPMVLHAGSQRYGLPIVTYSNSNRVTAAQGYRIAYRFVPAFDMECVGAGFYCRAADKFPIKIGVWEDDGTALASVDTFCTASSIMHSANWSAVTLSAGTVYHFGIEHNNASGTLRTAGINVTGTVDGSSPLFPLGGYASAWNTTAWAGAGDEQPIGFLEIEDPSGGGSSGYSRSRVVNG